MSNAVNFDAIPAVAPSTEAFETAPVRKWFVPGLVLKNIAALYGVQAGRKIIPLATIPYLARVLGPAGWGEVAFVTALAELIVIVIEFGFTLSATRSIARHRDDPQERARITVGVLCAQMMLAAIGVSIAIIASRFIPLLRDHPPLLLAGLVYAVAQGMVPLWYFQGTERIRLAAAIEVSAKTAGLLALFFFVKGPQHAWRALAIQAVSPIACLVIGLRLACANVSWHPEWRLVKSAMVEGWHMFVFRSAESIYGVANAFILGLFAPPAIVGYFSSAEKVSKATAGLANPIRESLYPRINNVIHQEKHEALRLARLGMTAMLALGFILSLLLFMFAQPIVGALMGGRFEPAVNVLRILSPLPFTIATTYSCGQLFLLPMRKDSTVLRIVFATAAVNLICSFTLGPRWGHVGMATSVLISETLVAASLAWNVFRARRHS